MRKRKSLLDSITSQLDNDVFNKLYGSFIFLLNNNNTILFNNAWNPKYEKPEKLTETEKFIIECTKNLEDLLEKPSTGREDYVTKLLDFRKHILEMEQCLQVHGLYLQRIGYILDHKDATATLTEHLDIPSDSSAHKFLIDQCIQFIESYPEDERFSPMRDILTCFPVKMAKENYLDYIASALNTVFEFDEGKSVERQHFIAAIIEMSKSNFGVVDTVKEQKYFRELIPQLDDLYEKAKNDFDQTLLDKPNVLFTEIESIRNNLLVAYESINFLTILFSFVPDIGFLINDNFEIRDSFYTIRKDSYADEELLANRVEELLTTEAEKMSESIQESHAKVVDSALPSYNKLDPTEELDEMTSIWDLITSHFYDNIIDSAVLLRGIELMEKNAQTDESGKQVLDHKRAVQGALETLRTALSRETPKTQRILKSYFFSVLPCPYTMEEFKNFLIKNIDDSLDGKEEALLAYKLYSTLHEAGFIGNENGEEFDDELPHLHNHDCDCGHHH